MAHALIGLGSNLGDRGALLSAARERLARLPQTSLLSISNFRESKPAGGPAAQPAFLNAAALLDSSLSPQQLLGELQRIENELGRERLARWGPRTLDLDLLLYDQLEFDSPELTLPHPRMSFRRFVLEPAAEIAAEMVYPINGWTIGKLLAHQVQSNHIIELAPTFSGWSEHAPATHLLKSLSHLPDVNPNFRREVPVTPTTPKQRRQALQRIRQGKRTVPATPIVKKKPNARWLVFDYWYAQLVFEGNFYSPDKEEIVRNSMLETTNSNLVVVWDPYGSDATSYVLERLRRRPEAPPVLWIPSVTLEQATQEVVAAMAAME